MDFAYYFHYCKNLKFEDRPDYSSLKSLFFDLLMQQEQSNPMAYPEFTFEWFEDAQEEKEEEGDLISLINNTKNDGSTTPKKKAMFDLDSNKMIEHGDEITPNPNSTRHKDGEDLINFKDNNSNPSKYAGDINNFTSFANNKDSSSFNKFDFLNIVGGGEKEKPKEEPKIQKLRTIKQEEDDDKKDDNWSEKSSGREDKKVTAESKILFK